MIKLNGEILKQERFPDNTLRCKIPLTTIKFSIDNTTTTTLCKSGTIIWHYEDDSELFALICLRKAILKADLVLPYIPNSRMDRVKADDEIFTLKSFCEIINDLNFDRVFVLDPHSPVSLALLDRVTVMNVEDFHYKAINSIGDENLVLFYPDEGAMKRYSESGPFKSYPSTFGIKNRDWKTGTITNYLLANPEVVKGKNVLIFDDICSYGGTFAHAAKALKEAGANDIYLYVSHAENNMTAGKMYNEDEVKHIFTTNSIFKKENDVRNKVTVFENPEGIDY